MSEYRQLHMIADLSQPLPELTPPEGMEVHTADEHARAAWNWIIKASFGPNDDYSMIEDDPTCAPERVFFTRLYMDVATATARLMDDGTGMIHMVGAHPWCQGHGAAYWAVLAAMRSLQALGVTKCTLSTDDFRKPAIVTYYSLGFKPLYDEGDEEMAARWKTVDEELKAYKKPARPEPIPLWDALPDPESRRVMPTLTPYPVEGARGAVVVCPGGGYHMLADHENEPIARMINGAGVSAYVLRYSLLPFSSLETPLEEARRAIRMVRAMGYEKVAILGFSAGGHLCAMAATRYDAGDPASDDPIERLSSRPDAFVPCYGATSLWQFRDDIWAKELACGHDIFDTIRTYSAEAHVTADTPPAFIWHTAGDDDVPVACAYDLARALSACGVSHEVHIYPHGPHGLGLAGEYEDVSTWAPLCQRWLRSMGYAAPRAQSAT